MIKKYVSNTVMHLLLILIIFINSQERIYSQEIETCSIKNLREHMDAIASDATEGRLTGSSGYIKAADYAVSIFREAGLKPGFTNKKGEKSFFQPVPFIRSYYKSSSLTILKNGTNKTFEHSTNNFVILKIGKGTENHPITSPAFLGYGISEPEKGWDDFAGLDLKGKWKEPVNMGKSINTDRQERFPGVSPDGKYLFFTRWHSSPYYHDLYWVDAGIIDDLKVQSKNN